MTHWLTPDGYNVMLRGLMGDAIKFTRIKYGNGTPGDGANDLPMLQAAGLGVAYRAKPAVRAAANAQLNYCDLSALLYAAGLAQTAWVTS